MHGWRTFFSNFNFLGTPYPPRTSSPQTYAPWTCAPTPHIGLLPPPRRLPSGHLTWCLGQIISDDWGVSGRGTARRCGISGEGLRDEVVLLQRGGMTP